MSNPNSKQPSPTAQFGHFSLASFSNLVFNPVLHFSFYTLIPPQPPRYNYKFGSKLVLAMVVLAKSVVKGVLGQNLKYMNGL